MTNGKEWKAVKTGCVLVVSWRNYPAYVAESALSADEGLEAFLAEFEGARLSALTASIDSIVGAA